MQENPLAQDLDHILAHTRGLWEELRGKRIFITGGTGFFGCWLLESFAWANDKLKLKSSALVLTRNFEAFKKKAPHLANHPAIKFQSGDVRSFDFPSGEFSHIIHAATESSAKLNAENPLLMFDTIVKGTQHTLDFAIYCKAKNFLLTSSGAVYGKQPSCVSHIPEEYYGAPNTMEPTSAYGEGKRAAEMLCSLYFRHNGLIAKIARCFAFVGPYLPLNIHYAIGNFIQDGLLGDPIQVKGDGTPLRSYLYGADLAIWLWQILFNGKPCRPYNVGSEKEISIGDLAKFVSNYFRPQPAVYFRRKASSEAPVEQYVPATKRAQSELGLDQWIDLGEAINRTILWQQHVSIT